MRPGGAACVSRFNTCETKLPGLRNEGFLAHRSPQGKMTQKSNATPASSETLVRNIRRATRKHHTAKEKIHIVLDGLRGETSIAELCRRQAIAESTYYSWSKEMEAGKRRLAADTARPATTDGVRQLRREAQDLKEVVAEQALELRLLKKSMIGAGRDHT
jgi:transposase